MGKLTDIQIRNFVKAKKPVGVSDGDGLTFTLSSGKTAAWVLRYRFGNKAKELTLGRYPDMSLADARVEAMKQRALIQTGHDVAQEKRQTKHASATAKSFRQLAEDYMDKKFPTLAANTKKQRRYHIERIILPKLGSLPARSVTTSDVVALIEPVGKKSHSVAELVLTAVSEIFKHGLGRHAVLANPCAGISLNASPRSQPNNSLQSTAYHPTMCWLHTFVTFAQSEIKLQLFSSLLSEGAAMTMLDLALSYAERGLPVFPLVPRSKMPLIAKAQGGRGVLDATCGKDKIVQWWTDCPAANIGLATGSVSGIDVLDVDQRHKGYVSLNAISEKHGRIGKTPTVQTGGGGCHILFRHREGMRSNAGIIGEGLDIRADGGYVVAAGSIHESGNAYLWCQGLSLDDVPLAEWPDWLSQMAMFNTDKQKVMPSDHWRGMIAAGVQEGGRNNAVMQLAGHLLGKRVDPIATLDLMQLWNQARCTPPLDDEEVYRIVENVAEREFKKRERAKPWGI